MISYGNIHFLMILKPQDSSLKKKPQLWRRDNVSFNVQDLVCDEEVTSVALPRMYLEPMLVIKDIVAACVRAFELGVSLGLLVRYRRSFVLPANVHAFGF